MAVIYLFDQNKKLKKPVKNVIEYIHREGEYTAEAQIRKKDEPAYGEFFGFMCADERFRLFLITIIDTDDETGVCTLTGIDAAVAELDGIVVERVAMQNVRAWDVIPPMLKNTGWDNRFTVWGEYFSAEDLYYTTAWTVMQTVGLLSKVRFDPVYEFTDGVITAKYVWVTERTNPFRGAIYTRKKGARNIQLTKEGRPYGRVYPIGKVVGDEEPPEQLTIAEAVWSVANGNPTDKTAGQTWIALPGATTADAYVFEDKTETDPLRLMEKGFSDLQERRKWHASGTANITDMSFARGYDYRPPTMWETVAIRTEDGETIETVITNIERYGVHTELTKIVVGEEETLEDQFVKMERQTVDAIKKAGGAGAGAGKAKRMILEAEELIQMNSERIEGNAREILLRATDVRVDQLENETIVKFQETRLEMDETRGALSTVKQDVDNINNAVAGAVGEIETLAGDVALRAYSYTVDELGKRVRDNESYIQLVPGLLEAKADLILLDGYVKADRLEAKFASFENTLQQAITSVSGFFTNISTRNLEFGGDAITWRNVKCGDSVGAFLSRTGQGTLELEHSHEITYDEATGKFTLAGVSSAGGSFSIADTQFYKDGVEAAAGLVTFSAQGWVGKQNTVKGTNGKTATVLLPNMTVKTVDAWDSLHKTYARLGYRDSGGNTVEAGYVEVNASDVYLAGKEAGLQEAGADYAEGYDQGKTDWNPVELRRETYSTAEKTVFVRAVNAADVSLLWANIDASELYDEGVQEGRNGVTLSQSGWANGQNTVTASNQRTETVLFPTFRASVDEWNSLHKTYVRMNYTNANGNTQQAAMAEVDASSVYLLGKSDGMAESGAGYDQGKADWMPVEMSRTDYDIENREIYVRAVNAAGVPVLGEWLNVRDIYDTGYADVSLSQDGWVGRQNTVRASNGLVTTVLMPNLYVKEDEWLTNNTKPVYITMTDKNGDSISLDSAIIDGSTIFTKGKNSVTLSQSGWVGKQNTVKASNGQQATVLLPTFTGSVDDWNSLHKTYARIKYTDSAGSTVEAAYVSVDASGVYADGQEAGYANGKTDWMPEELERSGYSTTAKTVTVRAVNAAGVPVILEDIDASEIYTAGSNEGYANGKTDWSPDRIERFDYDNENKLLSVRAKNAADVPLIAGSVDVQDVFDAGYHQGWNDVTVSAQGWVGKQNTVKAANGRQATVLLPTFTGSVDGWNSLNKTYARFRYTDSGGSTVEAGWVEVDAGEIFSAGEETVKGNITIGIDTPSSITHLGDNVYQMKVRIWAKYNGETIASTTAYPTKGLY